MSKKIVLILTALMMIAFISCSKDSDTTTPTGNTKDTTNTGKDTTGNNTGTDTTGNNTVQPIEVSFTGKINHDTYTKGETATVSFSRIPNNLAEFKAVQEKLGIEPHGAIALELMAFEMFRRNPTVGTECLKLKNTANNVNAVTSRLKELFRQNDTYARP